MTRRQLLASLLPAALQAAPPLKLAKIETLHFPKGRDSAPFWPHWTWLRLTTASGLQAVGETYPRTAQEAEMVHSLLAPLLKNRDLRDIERIWTDLYHTFDFQIAGGTEMRVLSALDLALWDLLGKSLNEPVYRLLGGQSNAKVRLYNTCFPHRYDFLTDPDKIMREVRERYGVAAIKVWPFDGAGRRNGGQFITQAQIDEALAPVRKLRDAFGNAIEILIEFHSLWNLPSAVRIARALEPYQPMWLEDMLLPGNFEQFRQLAESTSVPLIAGERMAGRRAFQQLLDARAVKYVMFDVCWCGGVSEAKKVAAMASARDLPVAPHTAGGPLLFYASTHLTSALSNVWIQESCQRFYEHDWPLMLEDPLVPKDGTITAPELPGFGMRIKPEVWSHAAGQLRVTTY
ncbi:MAG: mandelate racemase/muconate lactonizing enzyme family protein [Bryobacterales bacterium]|nr:mandelate racemase/muconate lactonizing enzyme family protein [Bryobacterales bacterium]